MPTGNETFSTLAPVMYSPEWVRRLAPTRNLEYGPWSVSFCKYVREGIYGPVLCIMRTSCDLQYAVDLAEMALLERISSSWVVMVLAMFVFTVGVSRMLRCELERERG